MLCQLTPVVLTVDSYLTVPRKLYHYGLEEIRVVTVPLSRSDPVPNFL